MCNVFSVLHHVHITIVKRNSISYAVFFFNSECIRSVVIFFVTFFLALKTTHRINIFSRIKSNYNLLNTHIIICNNYLS